eukprot:11122-Heterococcus_DN1.PRE.1
MGLGPAAVAAVAATPSRSELSSGSRSRSRSRSNSLTARVSSTCYALANFFSAATIDSCNHVCCCCSCSRCHLALAGATYLTGTSACTRLLLLLSLP